MMNFQPDPIVDRESLNRTIPLDVLPVDIDELHHADMGDRCGSVAALRLAVLTPETGQFRAPHFASSSGLLASSRPYMDRAMNPAGLVTRRKRRLQQDGNCRCRFLSHVFSTLCVRSRPFRVRYSNGTVHHPNMQGELPKFIKNTNLALDTY